MKDKILALLAQIEDEELLESIYWYIERKVVRVAPDGEPQHRRG